MRGLMAGLHLQAQPFPRDDQTKTTWSSAPATNPRGRVRVERVQDQDPFFAFSSRHRRQAPFSLAARERASRSSKGRNGDRGGDPSKRSGPTNTPREGQVHWARDPARDQTPRAGCASLKRGGQGLGQHSHSRRDQEVTSTSSKRSGSSAHSPADLQQRQPWCRTRCRTTARRANQEPQQPGGAADNFNEIRFEDKKAQKGCMSSRKGHDDADQHVGRRTILRNDTLNITVTSSSRFTPPSMTVEGVTDKDNPDKAKPVKSSMGITGAHTMDASDTIAIQAPNKITFTCGDSVITMVPGSITLTTAGSTIVIDPNIFAQSSGKATLMLDPNACIPHAKAPLCDATLQASSAEGRAGSCSTAPPL